jgi:hypothetical protein
MGAKLMEKTKGHQGAGYKSVKRVSVLGKKNNKDKIMK